MRYQNHCTAVAAVLFLLPAVYGGALDAPATRPVEGAVTYSVQGRVSMAAGLDLAKGDLSRVVVYVGSDPALDALSVEPARASVAQKNKAFVPDFAVIARGTEVEFPNWDHISHNVFSRSAAAPAFDLDRYPYGQSKTRTFDKVGVVQVFCNIHPTMRAIIVVTPNRFFTCANAEGEFKIEGLPAGHYQINAWQARCATQHQAIEVGPDAAAPISFTLDEDRETILANDPPQHGQKYGVERGLGLKRQRLNLPIVTESHPAPTTEPCADCN